MGLPLDSCRPARDAAVDMSGQETPVDTRLDVPILADDLVRLGG